MVYIFVFSIFYTKCKMLILVVLKEILMNVYVPNLEIDQIGHININIKTCVKQPLSKRPQIGF